MSTRCQIGFYTEEGQELSRFDALLYKHCDGYPSHVIPLILPFLQRFHTERGLYDTEYASAWLMHHLIADHIEHSLRFQAQYHMEREPFDGKNFLGHGISQFFHGDIEFFYAIGFNAQDKPTVRIYKCTHVGIPKTLIQEIPVMEWTPDYPLTEE